MKWFCPIAILALICIISGLFVSNVFAKPQTVSTASTTIPLPGLLAQPSLEELTNLADNILVGTVSSLNSYWNAEHTRIYTDVTLSLERTLKGTMGAGVVVKTPGGTAEGITERCSEAPSYAVGERLLLFLKKEMDGTYSLANWGSGKQIIEEGKVMPLNMPLTQVISGIGEILTEQGLPTPASSLLVSESSAVLPYPVNVTPPPIGASATLGWQDIMTEGFESTFPGATWTLYGNPAWGQDDYRPYTGTYSGWCARGGTLGLDPQTNYYSNNMDNWMIYGPFNLTGASDAELNFYFWLQSELNYD